MSSPVDFVLSTVDFLISPVENLLLSSPRKIFENLAFSLVSQAVPTGVLRQCVLYIPTHSHLRFLTVNSNRINSMSIGMDSKDRTLLGICSLT